MESKVSEKDMREIYFQAFGKQYDSEDRKQAPLPLDIAYLVALNKLKREGKYEGGGEITDDTYYQSVNDFVNFCMNYPANFLYAFGSLKNHLANKFKMYYNSYGSYGVMIKFYTELDSKNRRILTDFAYENYDGTNIDLDISEVEYFNSVNHFVFFCFNFPDNFMEAFQSNLRVHLSEKWSDAYNKKGSVGAMIYFWSELSDDNRKRLANWSKENYKGTRLYEAGGLLGEVAGMLPSPLPMSTIQPMAKGGGVSENAQTSFSIHNDYYGNLELGFYDIEFKNEKGTSISSKSFFKLDDAFQTLFEYLKSENGQYILEKEPKSNFYIEERYYDGKSTDYDGFPDTKYKTIFKISSKKINELIKSNNFENGGGIEPYIYFFNDGENDIIFTNFKEAYAEAKKLGYSKFRDNLGGEYFVNQDIMANGGQLELFANGGESKKLGVVKVIFENPEYNYITNVGVNVTEEEARNYFVGKMFDVGVYPKENMQKVIDIEFSKSKDNYSDGGGVESEKYQIKDNDKYFSIGMDGKFKWYESPDMGYTYTYDEVQEISEKIEEQYPNIKIVKYNKDWWKTNEFAKGGGVKSAFDSKQEFLKDKSESERIEDLKNEVSKHKWSKDNLTEESGIVKIYSKMYDLDKEIVSSIFNEYQKKYADGGEMDDISLAKSNAKHNIDFEYYAKEYAGDYWDKMSDSERAELMSDIRDNWFNDYEYADGGETEFQIYKQGKIEGKPFEVIGVNYKKGIVRVKNFSEYGIKEMTISEWIPLTFELGTPASFVENGREVSGEVVMRDGKRAISLYKDDNYGGDSERIRFFNQIDLKTLKSIIDRETFSLGGFLLGAGAGVLGHKLYLESKTKKGKEKIKRTYNKVKKKVGL